MSLHPRRPTLCVAEENGREKKVTMDSPDQPNEAFRGPL